MSASSSPRHRPAFLVSAAALAVGVAAGLLTVVPPSAQRAVVTVSRFGSTVRLLPQGLSISPLPLARRLILPRETRRAIIEGRVSLPQPGGATLPVRVRLVFAGDGVLPIKAADVRRIGWDASLGAWLMDALAGLKLDGGALMRGTGQWAKIFPGAQATASPDLTPQLRVSLLGLDLRHVDLVPEPTPEALAAAARQELAARSPAHGRLVVIGLDALDWELVDDLIRRGVMPNLARLVARGTHAALDVPAPLISPVVWTTIATGVSPELHGVLDFLEPDPRGGTPHPVSSASRKAPALWEMAAVAGRSSAVIGWWATFPAQAPAGGVVYSDRLTEQLLGLQRDIASLADPPEAAATARQLAMRSADVTAAMLAPLAAVRDDELAAARAGKTDWDEPVGGLAKLWAATTTVERLLDEALSKRMQFVLAYLEGTDIVGHLFAPYRAPALPNADRDGVRRFAQVVDRYHTLVDAWIGRVIAQLGPEDTLVIVSDHGFTWGNNRPRVAAGMHTATAVWWHRPQGVFIAAGPSIAHTAQRQRLDVLGVAPALLAIAGLPPAAEMPGKVPSWLIARESLPRDRVNYTALLPRSEAKRVELPPEAREEEIAKLRALGYLDGGEQSAQPTAAPPSGGPAAPAPSAPIVPAIVPAVDRAEARRLTNLGTSRASSGDKSGAEKAYREAIASDPTYAAAHYNLALLFRNRGDFELSESEFWQAVELGIREREPAVVQLALDYEQRGDAARADRALERGRRRFPESAIIWLNSGVFLGKAGKFEESRRCIEKAVQLDPENPAGHRNLAAALLALGDREGARRELAESLRLKPDQPDVKAQLDHLGGKTAP